MQGIQGWMKFHILFIPQPTDCSRILGELKDMDTSKASAWIQGRGREKGYNQLLFIEHSCYVIKGRSYCLNKPQFLHVHN